MKKTITLGMVRKKMKKLERRFDRTPKEATVARGNIMKKMEKLMDLEREIIARINYAKAGS